MLPGYSVKGLKMIVSSCYNLKECVFYSYYTTGICHSLFPASFALKVNKLSLAWPDTGDSFQKC